MMSPQEQLGPHLAIKFIEDKFWSFISPEIPIVELIKALDAIQIQLTVDKRNDAGHKYLKQFMLLVWNKDTKVFNFGCDPSIPSDIVIGAVEIIKNDLRNKII